VGVVGVCVVVVVLAIFDLSLVFLYGMVLERTRGRKVSGF